MPLTSGLARAVRQLRSELAKKLEDSRPGRHGGRVSSMSSVRKQGGRPFAVTAATAVVQDPVDWLVENYDVSNANAEAIIEHDRRSKIAGTASSWAWVKFENSGETSSSIADASAARVPFRLLPFARAFPNLVTARLPV
jgi:hypothetical protein